jgi:hypothetical protein
MTTLIRVSVAFGAETPGTTTYGVAPCAFLRGEPS